MIQVNETLTRQVAQLARLELNDQELKTFTVQLEDILGYVEQLQTVDTTSIQPLIHPFDLSTPLREDQVKPSPVDEEGKPKVLQSAPDILYDGFKVPPIL
jgi:aspartyl-tRNA(Asn)/glutamyl-tRNA(Gln) amidotransferase subunit C